MIIWQEDIQHLVAISTLFCSAGSSNSSLHIFLLNYSQINLMLIQTLLVLKQYTNSKPWHAYKRVNMNEFCSARSSNPSHFPFQLFWNWVPLVCRTCDSSLLFLKQNTKSNREWCASKLISSIFLLLRTCKSILPRIKSKHDLPDTDGKIILALWTPCYFSLPISFFWAMLLSKYTYWTWAITSACCFLHTRA